MSQTGEREMIKKSVDLVVLVSILVGVLGLTSNVHEVEAPYPMIYIRGDGSVDPSTANITSLDNVAYVFTADINASIVVEKDDTVVDGAGYTLEGMGSGTGIFLSGRSNVTVKNLNVKTFQYGVYLNSSSHSVVSENILTNNGDGVRLEDSSNFNRISGNKIADNIVGINLYSLYGSVFLEHNRIFANNVTNNENGISLLHSSNNVISGNNLEKNTDGIVIYRSLNNTISRNNVENNRDYGIYFDTSYDSRIYHNNFVDNGIPWYFYSSTNTWDTGHPLGGNYWSDYNETDLFSGLYQNETDSDGIGDTPYLMPFDNEDNYPLMGMFSDFNATSEHHVQTVCNSTISDFKFNGTTISFNVTGENGSSGFCRISIPRLLMNENYTVFVNGTEVSYNLLPFSNSTHSHLYFIYDHSTQEVTIISEFPTFLILPLFIVATLLGIRNRPRGRRMRRIAKNAGAGACSKT